MSSLMLPRLKKRDLLILVVHVLAIVSLRGHHLRSELDHVVARIVLVGQEVGALAVSLVSGSDEVVPGALLAVALAVLGLWRWRCIC